MYPFKLIPAVKDYIWGGDDLKKYYGKKSDSQILAETWELSFHKDGQSVIANGEFADKPLCEIVTEYNLAGDNCKDFEFFPSLIKFINSKSNLSIQVHPSDEYALKNEGQYGKTEMWYVVDAKEGSGIYYGFKKQVNKQEYIESIKNNTVTDLLNFIPVKKGEAYFIESGTVHAICEGLIIWELQQNSNVTYRVYDYDRTGTDGKKRELHIEKAVEVSTLTKQSVQPCKTDKDGLICKCKYFSAYSGQVLGKKVGYVGEDSFFCFTVISGSGNIEQLEFAKGDTIFLPARLGEYTLQGEFEYLACKVEK